LYPGKHITVIDHIDERVLGGIKIQVEDRLFDFTVQNSLKTLEKQLMER
jgi:F0F1-type ATP synthase delta subunit